MSVARLRPQDSVQAAGGRKICGRGAEKRKRQTPPARVASAGKGDAGARPVGDFWEVKAVT